ncbi:MAG: hypothetical protein H6594_04370 [Flavobacteriales bacterium]|nr:hydroxyacid dehydrogenase [Flavobacteriales bacterium]MCB9169570.1 hypothetical protein [Flavobacteriales bacterium]
MLEERLEAAGHICEQFHHVSERDLSGALGAVQGIIVRSRKVERGLMDGIPGLRFIGRVGSGLENIDTVHCAERGIAVLSAPEGNRDGVGEMAVAHLLVLLKQVCRANQQVRQGLWAREANRGHDLAGRTVGIIGYGHMGTAFAEKLQGFDVRILAHDKYRKGFGNDRIEEVGLATLQSECDVVSLHLPLTEETHHYVNAGFIERMLRPFWLLNTARGPVVDTAALLDGLDRRKVLGAGLDVLEFETPTLDGLDQQTHADVLSRLLAHEGVLLTPHVAGVTHEGKLRMATVLADKILKVIGTDHA